MKKVLLILFVFILWPLIYAATPIYQGLSHRGMVPMLSINYVAWPNTQPTTSEVFHQDFKHLDKPALNTLKDKQKAVSAPGYTAAIAIGGNMIWAGSVGWADIDAQNQMTTDTQLRIGSTSKALTATGMARLVASNTLNLDEPLSEYFDTLPNPEWAQITARHLASHMSGVPHYGENTEFFGLMETLGAQTQFPDVMDSVALFDESDMQFKPGEKFSYSSLGTVLLSGLMQIKAGMSYQDYMKKAVLEPLKMQATTTETPDQFINNLATFYWQDETEKTRLKPWYDLDLSHRLAGGGWVSTSKDLVKLGQGFIDSEFIPENVRSTFWTPQKLTNGDVNRQKYGLGWRIHDLDLGEGYKPLTYMHHGGVSAGAQSFLMVIPEYRLSIAVNANIRTKVFFDFADVSLDLARLFIDEIENRR